jgi:predicted acyl esterase
MSTSSNTSFKSEIRDGMQIDWDVPITMDDGIVLRADIFRPIKTGQYPTLISYGPYGKGLSFQKGYPTAWEKIDHESSGYRCWIK